VANALFVWGVARVQGAGVLLRIEDHDRQRCRPEYEVALLDDLDWLGFRPDRGATKEFRAGPSPWRQSDSSNRYPAAIGRLTAAGHRVYACDCSRKDFSATGRDGPGREEPYPGRCRDRGLVRGPGRGLRVVLGDGEECFDDLHLGPQRQTPAEQCGDLLLVDRLGNWTYQFAVVVDDRDQGIDLVIRGMDLLGSTGRQIRLARMLGRAEPPRFLHHALIRRPGGEKLSKANRDTSVRELRAAGATPAELFGEVLGLLGLTSGSEPVDLPRALEVAGRPGSTRTR
jgi:glutamyl-tRNA synthetase/glutamyl-Q tRNA(Asp) synthetase